MNAQSISRRSSSECLVASLGPDRACPPCPRHEAEVCRSPQLRRSDRPERDPRPIKPQRLTTRCRADSNLSSVARPTWPAGRSGAAVSTSREQEAHLFRKMNYLKYRANQLKEQLDPDWPSPADLDEIELLECEGAGVEKPNRRDEPAAGHHCRQGSSEGSATTCPNALATATSRFIRRGRLRLRQGQSVQHLRHLGDPEHARGNARRFIRRRGHPFALDEESLAAPDPGVDERERRRGPEPAAVSGQALARAARQA